MLSSAVSGEITVTIKLDGNPYAALELLQFLAKLENSPTPLLSQKSAEMPTVKKKTRPMSKEQLSKARTLANPLLYNQFCKKLKALNGDAFDPEAMVDTSLEYHEALSDIKKRFPQVVIYGKEVSPDKEHQAEYRDYVRSLGINDEKMLDLIVSRMGMDPFSDEQLLNFVNIANKVQEEPIAT